MDTHRYCVIMAGGSSPAAYLRMTYDRFARFMPQENILVVTLEKYAATARILLPELPEKNLLLEPHARKTAPCTAYATYTILTRDPDALVVMTPCDLVIRDEELFKKTIEEMFEFVAGHDVLMTLGIVPKNPDVNFGYIQVKEGKNAWELDRPLQVKTFTESLPRSWPKSSSAPANSSGTQVSSSGKPPSSARRWSATSRTSPNSFRVGRRASAIPPSSSAPTPNVRRSPWTTA